LWRSRTGRKSPKASFNPLPIEAFATETASSYPNPVEESYKVDQVFCNLVDQYGENRRHKFVSRSFERPPQFSSYQCNEERVPDMADMQLWKGGLTSYAGAEWLRTRSSRHLRGMQQVRTVVWSPPKSRPPHHKTVQLPRMLHQLHILVLGYGLRGPVLDQTFSSPRISAVQLSLALLTTNTIADLRS